MGACGSCGQDNPTGFRICGMCGATLQAGGRRREERKVVSCLFCDLVGFTARAETLDPEDVRALLTPFHARVRLELERHGGTVEKFIGDAVVAVFGAPIAHEDDPERAVRAALAIRGYAEVDGLELRVGITTGEALIDLDARPDSGEGIAAGDVVNTAARLQAAAPTNGVLVDEPTYRATRDVISFGEEVAVTAKGKALPIAARPVVAAISRFGSEADVGRTVELVGRDDQLELLRDALARTRTERSPSLVTLIGAPGIGKSRLVAELFAIVDADTELITWRRGRCLAYGNGIAFWALGEIVKAHAGISEGDPTETVERKLHEMLEAVLSDERDLAWVETHLRPLVGLEAEAGPGGDRRGEAFAAWRLFLTGLASAGSVVIVVEDLHWADDGMLDFLDELLEWLDDVPLLVLCTSRPELLDRRPAWNRQRPGSTSVALEALSDEETARLIAIALGRPLALDTQRELVERAGGNPLYAEQFARLFEDRGSTGGPLPETLQGIVAARIDGLPGAEKATLQDAAVVGKVFWTGALGGDPWETGERLLALDRKGLVVRQRRSSVEGETEWSFSHMVLRDVAYGEIPRADRAEKHRRTALWIDRLGRAEDHAEVVAHHWRSALQLSEAAGRDTSEFAAPARSALRAAGDRAAAVHALAAAVVHYQDAIRLWPADDPARPRLLLDHARALDTAADPDAETGLTAAAEALRAAGDRDGEAEAEVMLSQLWWSRGQRDISREHQARALELVGEERSPTAARVMADVARTRMIGGDPGDGLRIAQAALAMAEEVGLAEVRLRVLTTIGIARGMLGDEGGIADIETALELALETDSAASANIANNLGVSAFFALDLRGAAELFSRGEELAKRFGDGTSASWLHAQQVAMAVFLGRWDEAAAVADDLLARWEAGPTHYMEVEVRAIRGLIREARGDADGALADVSRGLVLAREAQDPQALVPALGSVVRIRFGRGETDLAEALLDELVTLARIFPYDAAWGLTTELFLSDAVAGREDELRVAIESGPEGPWRSVALACLERDFIRVAERFAEAGSPSCEAIARLMAASELVERSRPDDAQTQLDLALPFFRSVGATFYLGRAARLLARSA